MGIMMKHKIRHFLHKIKVFLLYENKLTPILYKSLCRFHLVTPSVIVYVDGGICSQMHQYLLGRFYAEKGCHVAYDLGWYKRNGMDNNGVFERRFEFNELYPNLPFEKASAQKVAFYSRVFPYHRDGMKFPTDQRPPVYFGGYYTELDNRAYAQCFSRWLSVEHCMKILNIFNKRGGGKMCCACQTW